MNLTLNDFRSVLGVKNDGDVVMTLDKNNNGLDMLEAIYYNL